MKLKALWAATAADVFKDSKNIKNIKNNGFLKIRYFFRKFKFLLYFKKSILDNYANRLYGCTKCKKRLRQIP